MAHSRAPRAFTLIELLVVIAIIGLLSSVVLASLNTARAKARDAKRFSDLEQVRTALEMYYADHGAYPVQRGEERGWMGTTPGCYDNPGDPSAAIPGLVSGGYISAIPQDPNPQGNYCYLYSSNGSGYKFMAFRSLESGSLEPGDPHSRYAADCTGKSAEPSAAVYSSSYRCN